MCVDDIAPITLDVLGRELHLYIDPKNLNEAGVVWDDAVQALADACAPELQHRAGELHGQRILSLLELGAGTGALGIALAHAVPSLGVMLTDLEHVMPLMESNIRVQCDLAPGASIAAATLAWGERLPTLPDGCRGGWDVMLGCEILYWGGWNLFSEDTRGPLLRTLIEACGPSTEVYFAFTVRDRIRELSYVLDDIGNCFTLRRLGLASTTCAGVSGTASSKVTDGTKHSKDEDGVTRIMISSASDGDLVMFGARLKTVSQQHSFGNCAEKSSEMPTRSLH